MEKRKTPERRRLYERRKHLQVHIEKSPAKEPPVCYETRTRLFIGRLLAFTVTKETRYIESAQEPIIHD